MFFPVFKKKKISVFKRYQSLLTQSKEMVNRWQDLVDAHKAFVDKLKETEDWLTAFEKRLNDVKNDSDLPSKSEKLKVLLSENEQAPHKLTNLATMAENLYPETSAAGREQIRNSLKEIRDK